MKVQDLIKKTANSAFIGFGVYGLINGSSPIFYAIFTLLSVGSLLLSLKDKDNKDDDKNNKRESWDDIRKRENNED
jgi:hypothetical protein